MDQSIKRRLDSIDQIKDHVSRASPRTDPFLYFLPDILMRPQFIHIIPENVLVFAKFVETNEKSPIIVDALQILNQLVNTEDGSIHNPGPQIFYTSQNFHWKELGEHTNAPDVIMHVINKTIFILSLENTQ